MSVQLSDEEEILEFAGAMSRRMPGLVATHKMAWRDMHEDELWEAVVEAAADMTEIDVAIYAMMICRARRIESA